MPYRRRRRRSSLKLAPAVDRPPADLPPADATTVRQVKAALLVGLVGSLLFGAAVFAAGRRTGAWLGPLTMAVLGPIAVAGQVAAFRRVRHRRLDWANYLAGQSVGWLLAVGAVFGYALAAGTPRAVFARVVGQPMPHSTREFHWHRDLTESPVGLITFKAAPEDVAEFILRAGLAPNDATLSFIGEASELSPAAACNRGLSNLCLQVGVPFEPLPAPVYYTPTSTAAGLWQGKLFTDPTTGRVYLFR